MGEVDLDPDPERDRIDLLAEEFAASCRSATPTSVSEFAAHHPEFAEQIRAMFPAVALMEQLKHRRRGPQSAAAAEAGAPVLERLGDLRIIREIGRGGMGIVYEAVQETLDRRVALKVLPRHAFLDPRTLQRFQREAQAVALLHHVNIVPVFGVGEHDGLHYYVMQLISGCGLHTVIRALRRGAALSKIVESPRTSVGTVSGLDEDFEFDGESPAAEMAESRSPLDDRDWRFVARVGLQVAEALEYAHGQGVLHRDIKPANLLLDERGTVWVTDFGLAKLAQQGDLTATGDIIGTLQYMAPEGLQGESDVRSDVYGLGMTLYELLTLEPPFDESNPSRLIRRLGEDQPVRPRKRNPSIPRDLETIVLKATARAPRDRYPTARAMADDLQRFLDDRPVRARRATVAEQFGRWCRRNKALAALAATALASLIFAAVVGWVGYATTRTALERESMRRREADAATRRAEANVALSLDALEEIFNNLTPHSFTPRGRALPPDESSPPGSPFRRGVGDGQTALLESILDFYDRFAALNETNATLKREAAKAHRHIGEIRQQLGQFDEAESAFQRAVALYKALTAEFPDSPDDRQALAETLIVHEPRSEAPEYLEPAVERLRRAMAIEESLAGEFPEDLAYAAVLAEVQGKLGTVLDRLGRTGDAEVSLRRAVALRESLSSRFPDDPLAPLHLAVARSVLGGFRLKQNQSAEARTFLDASAEGLRVMASKPLSPGISRVLAQQLDDLAAHYRTLGETALVDELTAEARVNREPWPNVRRPGPGPGPPPPRGRGPGPPGRDRPPPPPPGSPWEDGGGPFPPNGRRPPPSGPGL